MFLGGFDVMARACLWLRTAERVLLLAGEFPAKSFEALYEGNQSAALEGISQEGYLHSCEGQKRQERACSAFPTARASSKRPLWTTSFRLTIPTCCRNPGTASSWRWAIRSRIRWSRWRWIAAARGFSRRGYRTFNVAAPISETLGAAIVLLSRYHPDQPFIDPMCGSGTMPIEAAMIARNMAPGMGRSFAAEEWSFLEPGIFEHAREEARDAITEPKLDILGSDIDAHSIDLCKKHAKKAGIMVNWAVRPLKELKSDRPDGVLVCNPPYGERMMERREAEKLYREMRSVFDALDGWKINVITSHADFERIYGRRADKRRKLSNGGMPCTLYQYFRQ